MTVVRTRTLPPQASSYVSRHRRSAFNCDDWKSSWAKSCCHTRSARIVDTGRAPSFYVGMTPRVRGLVVHALALAALFSGCQREERRFGESAPMTARPVAVRILELLPYP